MSWVRALVVVVLLAIPAAFAQAQSGSVAEITVHAGTHDRQNVPVMASLAGVPLHLATSTLQLFEVTDGKNVAVPSQIKSGNPDQLAWVLSGTTAANSARKFELRTQSGSGGAASMANVTVADDGDNLSITVGGKPVLGYRYTPMPVPEGVREIFSSSGFIHPLHSPQGEVLSRIQPPDHWHHYGLWNPWTHTEFEGDTVDFWNIGSRQGRVRSDGVIERTSGDVFGNFRSLHEHIAGNAADGEKVALKEQWEVTVWNSDPDQEAWVIDFASTMSPASDSPLKILAYRYQGFSLRATEKWGDANSRLLTSEGMDKSNGNATRARWIDVNGASGVPAGTSGILFMSNPGNYNFPEQLRIWPTGQNRGVENVFINFNPAQEQDWLLEPGQTYALKYRMFVYDGSMTAERAERLWRDYADPPRVEVRTAASR
jgi:hypothetical protein